MSKSTDLETRLRSTPVPRDNFNDIDTAGGAWGSTGSPKCPTLLGQTTLSMTYSKSTDALDAISEKLDLITAKGGLAIAVSTVLTNMDLLRKLTEGNAIAMFDKFRPSVDLCKKYNQINPGYLRNQLPGGVFKHLQLRKGPDYGLLEGPRQVGCFYDTMRKPKNETRPFMHRKFLVGLLPKNKDGKLVPKFVFDGTMNLTENAKNSFEAINYSEDFERAAFFYSLAEHTYSISEGLYSICRGLTPEFEWVKKVPSTKSLPRCPDCGKQDYSVNWWQPEFHSYASRVLVCRHCGESVSYVKVPSARRKNSPK